MQNRSLQNFCRLHLAEFCILIVWSRWRFVKVGDSVCEVGEFIVWSGYGKSIQLWLQQVLTECLVWVTNKITINSNWTLTYFYFWEKINKFKMILELRYSEKCPYSSFPTAKPFMFMSCHYWLLNQSLLGFMNYSNLTELALAPGCSAGELFNSQARELLIICLKNGKN